MSLKSEHTFSSQLSEVGGISVRDRDPGVFDKLVRSLHDFHVQQIPRLGSGWKEELVALKAAELVTRLQLMRHLRKDGATASSLKKEDALAEYLRLLHQEYKLTQCRAVTEAGSLVIQEGPPPQPPQLTHTPRPTRDSSARVAERTDQALLAALQALTKQVSDLAAGQRKLEERQSEMDRVPQTVPQEPRFAT